MNDVKQLSKIQTALMLAFLVTVWGINWPLTKAALAYSPPLLFAGIRTLIGGLLLLMVVLPRFKKLRFKETWPIYLISAILNITLFYGLQTVGLNYLHAGLFSAIVFFQPVLMGVFSWLWLGESMYPLKIAGLILGFAGVAVISAAGFGGHISIAGILLALGSAVSWALGTVYVKRTGGLYLDGRSSASDRRRAACQLRPFFRKLFSDSMESSVHSQPSVHFSFCYRARLARLFYACWFRGSKQGCLLHLPDPAHIHYRQLDIPA